MANEPLQRELLQAEGAMRWVVLGLSSSCQPSGLSRSGRTRRQLVEQWVQAQGWTLTSLRYSLEPFSAGWLVSSRIEIIECVRHRTRRSGHQGKRSRVLVRAVASLRGPARSPVSGGVWNR